MNGRSDPLRLLLCMITVSGPLSAFWPEGWENTASAALEQETGTMG